MEKLKFRKSLSILENETQLAKSIVDTVKEKMSEVDITTLMYDSQFLVDICKCVDKNQKNMTYQSKWTIQKKHVVLKAYFLLYADKVDMARIESLIDFAEENNLIKRKSIIRMVLELLGKFF